MSRPRFFLFLAFAFASLALIAEAMAPRHYRQGEIQHGQASWYGAAQGHRTASGERFNQNDLTAAHRRLPFGTLVRVTNEQNGRTVNVRINDRGPWTSGRILDVSSAAADILQMKRAGTVPVQIEILELGSNVRYHARQVP